MSICIGAFIFDPDARELRYGARVHRLEPKAAAVLVRLAHGAAQTVRRSELLDACWASGEGSDEALTQAIAQIRRAFSLAPGATQYIQTVARTGYRLRADVQAAPPMDDAVTEHGGAEAATRSIPTSPWLALAVLVVALSVAVMTIGPHGLRHWLLHGAL